MILLINICKEKLHFEEFVKPVGNILMKNNIKGFIRQYDCVTKKDLEKASKIIICGTSIKDNEFLENIKMFNWIKDYKKPILGICGGMHALHLTYGGKKHENKKIGQVKVTFNKKFLGLEGTKEVYNLHQYFIDSKEFNIYNKQYSKQKTKPFYGVLFHPEVRNKELITNFLDLNNQDK